MFLSPQEALAILEHYKYFVIFPITVIEGPIITVIGGFLIYLGYLDWWLAYFFLVLGDWVGDGLHYLLGRYYSNANWFKKIGGIFGYDKSKEEIIEKHFQNHPGKTVLLAKVSHGVGGLIQIVAGMSKMNFYEFMKFSLYGTLPKTFILILIGYYLGNSYEQINQYMDRIAFVVLASAIIVLIYYLVRRSVNEEITTKN